MAKHNEKLNLGLAGEYRVTSELLLRGYSASIVMGNAKATDIIILHKNSTFLRVEVKTSKNNRNFVTSYTQKYSSVSESVPDIWIFFVPSNFNTGAQEEFFIMSHSQVNEAQLIVNKGKVFKRGEGVDNIPIKILKSNFPQTINNWDMISDILK